MAEYSHSQMQETEITEGCLGPFGPTLRVGDIQHMVFRSSNDGPFYLAPHERQ